ncbi:MAG: diguanylate cyclase [Clostridiales bacterium]|nr:diguanylate cyclase [Clostridiales bacterium]
MPKQTKRTQPAPSRAARQRKPADGKKRRSAGALAANETADSGFAAMALCHEDGRLIHIDPALITMLAYPEENIKTLNLFDLLADPHDQKAVADALKLHGDLRAYHTSLHHACGMLVPVLLSIQKFECAGMVNLMVLLQGFDRGSEKQQQSEARYHLIFNNVPVGIAITDREGAFCAFNPAISEMLGYSPAELQNMKSSDVYKIPGERSRLVSKIFKEKTVRNYEVSFIRKDGAEINVLLNADLINYGYLKNVMLSSFRDITELKSVESKLIKERNFSETVLDTSDSLIMVFTGEGRVIKFNKACEKTTGYTFGEMQGKPYWELISADPALAQARMRQIIEDRRIDKFESYWVTRDGRRRLISWANVLLQDEDGNDYIVSTGSDITERRKAHEAVRDANRELEQSLRRLEERNRAISLFADMEGFLQGCRTVEEACTICAQFVQSICPETSGGIYLISEENDQAEARETWGDESVSQKLFTPSSCWSVRRGRLNLIDQDHRGLPCQHIRAEEGGQYLCIPMETGGETLGIMHLSFISSLAANEMPSDSAPYFESKLRLLTTAAETTALSLSNIILQNTLRQQSIRDSLTGIYNRRYMVETLSRELSRAHREQAAVSALMFDIDHFKEFNDTYGHDGGDMLLMALGIYLKQNTRSEDIACRYGGEEFVLVLPNTRHQSAVQKAEALRLDVSKLSVTHLGKALRACTISIGVATFPQNGQTAEELLKAVDDALYTAKRKGRNRVVSSK